MTTLKSQILNAIGAPIGKGRIVTCGGCGWKVQTSKTIDELYHGALECPQCEGTDFDEMEVK